MSPTTTPIIAIVPRTRPKAPLTGPGGLIVLDDLPWGGQVADPAIQDTDTLALCALHEKLQQDPRIADSLLPVADGLGLALRL